MFYLLDFLRLTNTLPAEIIKEWPLYTDLHDLWSALPNYNPVGVSNATPGQDHANNAVTLFAATGPSILDDGNDKTDEPAEVDHDIVVAKDGYDRGSSDFYEDEEAKLREDDILLEEPVEVRNVIHLSPRQV